MVVPLDVIVSTPEVLYWVFLQTIFYVNFVNIIY